MRFAKKRKKLSIFIFHLRLQTHLSTLQLSLQASIKQTRNEISLKSVKKIYVEIFVRVMIIVCERNCAFVDDAGLGSF